MVTDTQPRRSSFGWIGCAALLGLSCVLFAIGSVIVLALIPLYLPRAQTNVNLLTTDEATKNYILNYKTNFKSANSGTDEISDVNALSQSLNQYYGFSSNFIQGKSTRLVTDHNQRRRRRENQPCQGDTGNLNGDLLTIRFQGQNLNSCANIQTCLDSHIAKYLTKIRSHLTQFPLPVSLKNQGTRTITAAFCSLEQIDLLDGTWMRLDSKMSTARTNFPAVKLVNDRILVSGGKSSSSNILSSSEIFTPSSSSWTSAGSMTAARQYHAMTLLANGNEVLVTGGDNNNSTLATAELYNINSGSWSSTSKPMPEIRTTHTSTLLNNNRVLIAGGIINTTQTAIYYDPTTSDWVQTGNMIASYREAATATLLNDDRVLVTGGATASKLPRNTAEIYNPTTNSWTQTSGNMINSRFYHSAIRLPDGNVLIVGGRNASDTTVSSAELYLPSSNSFVAIDSPTYGGTQMTLTLLANNFVLATPGGDKFSNCPVLSELYDPTTRKWLKTGFLNVGRQANFAFPISNRVLTCGGDNADGILDSCEYLSFD